MSRLRWRKQLRRLALGLACGASSHIALADNFTWEPNAASVNWESPTNWAGTVNQVPDSASDTALVDGVNDNDPTLTQDRIVGELTIRNNGDVHTGNGTNNFFLGVANSGPHTGTILIEGVGSSLSVYEQTGFDVDADIIRINNGGSLFLQGGGDVRIDSLLDLNGGGTISGNGVLEIGGTNTSTNDGTIRATGGTLIVRGTGTATLDIDGSLETGNLIANSGATLHMQIPFAGPEFDGTVTILSGGEIRMDHPWELNNTNGTQLTMGGPGGQPATLSGAAATLENEVNVSGHAILAAPTVIGPNATVDLPGGTVLQFDAHSVVHNPASMVNSSSSFVVNDVVDMGTGFGNFDWDGSGLGNSTTTVNPGGALNIDAARIDAAASAETFNGSLVMNSGDVDVRVADGEWEMAGLLELNNTVNSSPNLTGDNVRISGEVQVAGNGESVINASSQIVSTSVVTVGSDASLRLGGSTTNISGGTWQGSGVVNLDAAVTTISGPTTVDMPNGTFDLDGDNDLDTLRINAPLLLNVDSLDDNVGFLGVDNRLQINGAGGQLNVQFTDPTQGYQVNGELELNGPVGGLTGLHLVGADVSLAGTTTVSGNSTLQARVEFSGTTSIADGGQLNLQGGSASSPDVIRQSAAWSGPGELHVTGSQLNIEDGSVVGVRVENRGRIEPGIPGASIGTATLAESYFQDATGTLGYEIAGPPGGNHDLLQVSGIAVLSGGLEVTAIGGFVPSIGDVYTVMTAGLRINEFDSLSIQTDSIFDVEGVLNYGANFVELEVTDISMFGDFDGNLALNCADVDALVAEIAGGGMNGVFDLNGDTFVDLADLDLWLAEAGTFNVGGPYLAGDANLDGLVDGSDFSVWNSQKFTSDNGWCGADFNADGFTDGSDFGLWNANKFTSSAAATSMVPEPLLGSGILIVIGGCLQLRRRVGSRHCAG